jgi:hypothetical protein
MGRYRFLASSFVGFIFEFKKKFGTIILRIRGAFLLATSLRGWLIPNNNLLRLNPEQAKTYLKLMSKNII